MSIRWGTSSASCAELNHVKFIHAHHTAKNTAVKPTIPWAMWPASSSWCRATEARLTATTNVRSNSSSSGEAARASSAGSRSTARPRSRSGVSLSRIAISRR